MPPVCVGHQGAIPFQDRSGYPNDYSFGSAHSSGFNMVFCDGSVHSIGYSIDVEVHRCLANRKDGKAIDGGTFRGQKAGDHVGQLTIK